MKNTLSFLMLLFLSVTAISQGSNFVLKGKIDGLYTGMMYLNYRDVNSKNVLDSTVVKNGDFNFKGNIAEPTRVFLYSSAKKQTDPEFANEVLFFIEPSSMVLRLEQGRFFNLRLSGSKTQDEWIDYQKKVKAFEMQWQPVLATIKKAESEKNWPLYDSLSTRYLPQYDDRKKQLYLDFVRANPDSFISLDLLSLNRHRLPFDSLNRLYQQLKPFVKRTQAGSEMLRFISKEDSLQIGRTAPDIAFTDKDSVKRTLADFKGKYVLLDFWASWCVPCRQENPYLVEVYKKYKAKGFEIISFSLDRQREKQAWLDAIAKDSMTWLQICDFKYWNSEITTAFNLFGRGIPVNFLLDKDGKIIGRDIRGWKLEEYLQGRLE
jgi:thiol-disulfide isomerase/thioredoxin